MPHIDLDKNLPGIRALMAYSPETAEPLGVLAELLLRSNTSLSPSDRELIGTYVSYLNDCFYCHHSHGEIAVCYLNGDRDLVDAVRRDYKTAPISEKLKSLLQIAGKVQKSGKSVLPEDIEQARQQGATDHDIHDTVLIAAAFCLFKPLCRWSCDHRPTGYVRLSAAGKTDRGKWIWQSYFFETTTNMKRRKA